MMELAASDPGRLAIAGDGERLTYGELHDAAARIRAGVESLLQDRPASGSDGETGGVPIVAVSCARAIDAARLLVGVASFRAIVAVLDPLWPLEHRLETIRRVDPALVITDDAALEAALSSASATASPAAPGWHGRAIPLAGFDALAAAAPASAGPEVRPRDEPYLLLFTSGTTDLPKGFLRTRGSWDYNVEASRGPLFAGDRVQTIAPGPVSYSLTLYALVEALATGGSLHLQSRFDAADAVRTIERHGIERFVGVPSMLLALAAAARGGAALASLRWVITGGANQSEAIRERFRTAAPQALLRSYYGASEIGFIGTSDAGDGTRLTPFAGLAVEVRDEAGARVPDGEIGTLHIRVASQVERYLTATSAERITGADGWSSVGDLASVVDGEIVLAGRAGDIAVTGGHKVSLPQVERALATVPGCDQCCAIALPDAGLGSIVAVVVEGAGPAGAQGAVPAKAVVQAELRRLLPEQFVPRRYFRVDALPRTAGGKIRRVAVAELVAAGAAERL